MPRVVGALNADVGEEAMNVRFDPPSKAVPERDLVVDVPVPRARRAASPKRETEPLAGASVGMCICRT